MRRTYSMLIRISHVLCVLVTALLNVQAWALTQFTLPAGSQPLQIDASSPSGNVYFVDLGLGTINQINGGAFMLSWSAPFSPSATGSIVVDRLAATQFVYVTDLPGNTLGQLDVIGNLYYPYNLTLLPWNVRNGPRQLVFDDSRSVEPNDDAVWFSASGDAAIGSVPLIGYLAPTSFTFHVWLLPSTVASPGDAIDGLAFKITASGPTVFFTVNGPAGSGRNILATLSPISSQIIFWQLPASYSQPMPIVATPAGEVYRLQCPGCNTMARIRTSASVLDAWMSPGDSTDMFLTLDPVALVPRFTSTSAGLPAADMLITTCPPNTTPLVPNRAQATPDIGYLQPDPIPVPPIGQDTPPQITNLDSTTFCPWIKWLPIGATGPISMDNAGPPNTWISETSVGRIAFF